jgi:tetratricopeptide (TPR) repeat protein
VDEVQVARAAIKAGDAAEARRRLEQADGADPAVRELLAQAYYLELDYPAAIEAWESAYPAYRAAGDAVGAVRIARTLAGMYYAVRGEPAVGAGWMARARTLLPTRTGVEAGWVALNSGMFEGDRARKEAYFREAVRVGAGHDDRDLELTGLSYLGASLVHADRTEEGMVLLDEALAGVTGGEIDDFMVLEEIFCQLFAACEHAHDVSRAEQWIRIGDGGRPAPTLPAVSAFCRTHYGGVLTAAGRWPEADAALTDAIRSVGPGRALAAEGGRDRAPGRPAGPAGPLRRGRATAGRPVRAPQDAARPMAAVYLDRGETTLAPTCWSGRWRTSSRRARPARRCWRCWSTSQLAAGRWTRRPTPPRRSDGARGATTTSTSRRRRARPGPGVPGRNDRQEEAAGCLRRALHGFSRARDADGARPRPPRVARAMQTDRPRWRWPRPAPRWRRTSGSTPPARSTPPRPCCVPSGYVHPRRGRAGPLTRSP